MDLGINRDDTNSADDLGKTNAPRYSLSPFI